jgi:hypothetical protein
MSENKCEEKPVFNLEDLRVSAPRTAEDAKRLAREGRVAEINPERAGLDN